MRRLRAWTLRLADVFRADRRDRELADELDSHLQLHIDDNIRAGMTPADARRHAIIALGGIEQAKEQYRERRRLPALAHILHDARYGLRTLRRSPGFTAAAVATLALGLGANMAIFRFVDAVVVQSLPVPEPERLVLLRPWSFSYPAFRDIAAANADIFSAVAARWAMPVNLSTGDTAELVHGEIVSGTYFAMLGVSPHIGRLLGPADDGAEGAHRVCVISYGLWHRRFGGDPGILGRTIELDAEPFEVVGVTPRGFHGGDLHARHDLQIPTSMVALFMKNERDSTSWSWIQILARLSRGVTREEAQAVLQSRFTSAMDWQKPEELVLADGRQGVSTRRSQLEDPVLIAQLMSGCVLLIACATLSGLLLVSASSRRREIAVRQSLGASRTRLVSQVLVESSVLSTGGLLLGVWVAALLHRVLASVLHEPGSTFSVPTAPSTLGLVTALALAVLTAVGVGLLPALVSTRQAPLDGLRDSPRAGARTGSIGRALIVGQVAICLVLVFAAGLFARSLHALRSTDLGVDPQRVIVLSADPERNGYSREESMAFYDEWVRRARLIPGVDAVGVAHITAMSGAMFAAAATVPDAEPRDGPKPNNHINVVSADYFRTVGLPLLAGRTFADHDTPAAPRVAIVNERFAEYYWPGRSPIGSRFTLFAKLELEVVGLVPTAKYQNVREEPQITIYLPLTQRPTGPLTLHVRTGGDIRATTAALSQSAHAIAPRVPLFNVATLEDYVDARLSNERALNVLSSLFAVLALVVACAGLYGLVAYTVVRRRREIGIRLAVGAQRGSILHLFLKDVLLLVAMGLVLGVPLCIASGKQFAGLLYGLEPSDLSTLLLAAGTLAVMAIAAATVPAIGATRVDPVGTLRDS